MAADQSTWASLIILNDAYLPIPLVSINHSWCPGFDVVRHEDAGGDIGMIWGAATASAEDAGASAKSAAQAESQLTRRQHVPASFQALCAPATTVKLKQSLGPLSIARVLRAAVEAG